MPRPRVRVRVSGASQRNERWAMDVMHTPCVQDGWAHLAAVIDCHDREIVGYEFALRSRAKEIGTPHGVEPRYLPNDLDEFVFRLNRRQTPMAAFQTLRGIASGNKPVTLAQLRSYDSSAQAFRSIYTIYTIDHETILFGSKASKVEDHVAFSSARHHSFVE